MPELNFLLMTFTDQVLPAGMLILPCAICCHCRDVIVSSGVARQHRFPRIARGVWCRSQLWHEFQLIRPERQRVKTYAKRLLNRPLGHPIVSELAHDFREINR